MGEGVAPHRLGNGKRVREEEERYGGGGVFCPSAHTEVTVFQLNPPLLPLTSAFPIFSTCRDRVGDGLRRGRGEKSTHLPRTEQSTVVKNDKRGPQSASQSFRQSVSQERIALWSSSQRGANQRAWICSEQHLTLFPATPKTSIHPNNGCCNSLPWRYPT